MKCVNLRCDNELEEFMNCYDQCGRCIRIPANIYGNKTYEWKIDDLFDPSEKLLDEIMMW